MISFSADIIWQPLHTPSEKVSARAKKASNSSRARGVEQDALGPALAGAEHVAVGEAAAGHQPGSRPAARGRRPGRSCARRRLEAGAVEGRGHLDLAVDALLAQDRDARAGAGAMNGAAMSSAGSKVSRGCRPGSSSSGARSCSSRRIRGCRAAPAWR
jgi:hypothetical protein